MKNLFITLCLFCSLYSKAQITIDDSHMPTSGDSLRFSLGILDTTLLFNYENSGSNLVWDFDSLIPLRQGVNIYSSSAQSPYNISNRIAEKIVDTLAFGDFEFYDVYNFYSTTSSKFSMDYRGVSLPTGLSFPFPSVLKIAESYADEDEIYQFPLAYLDRDSSTFNFEYRNSLIGVYYGSSGYRINEVDAWGSLTTPYGTFDCIRVVTDIVGSDSLSFGTTNFSINNHQREYKWLSNQLKMPALTVSGNVIGEVFIPTTVEYRDSIRNVPSLLTPLALFLANQNQVELGDTVEFFNFSVSLLPLSFVWTIQPEGGDYINGTSSTSDSITVVFNDTGFYDVQLIARNSSGSDTLLIENYIRVRQAVGINEVKEKSKKFSIFPNPVKKGSLIFIQQETNIKLECIKIMNLSGKLIKQIPFNQETNRIQFRAPEIKGVYIIQIKTEEGLENKRLIIE